MAESRRFENRIDEIEAFAKNPQTCLAAITAAKYFAKALEALQVEYAPDVNDDEAHELFYSLVRDYFLDAAADIEGFIDDDNIAG